MNRTLAAVALLLPACGALPAVADGVAETCEARPAKGVVLKALLEGMACVGFETRVGGRVVSKGRLGFQGSGTLLTTGDGRSVIFVQTHPYTWTPEELARLPGVVLFRDGTRLASYTIAELLERTDIVSWSVSHVSWVSGREGGSEAELQPPGATWTLYTSSFREIEFDSVRGTILRAGDTELWKSCDRIAFGTEGKLKGQTLVFEKPYAVKGSVPWPLQVSVPDGSTVEEIAVVLCLDSSLRLVRTIGDLWILNGLSRRPSAAPR
jgi:hypothetical protein